MALLEVLQELDQIIEERDYFKAEYYEAMALLDRQAKGPDRPNRRKLTGQEVKDIRAAYRGGMKQADLARNYGVNPATISRIVRGIYY